MKTQCFGYHTSTTELGKGGLDLIPGCRTRILHVMQYGKKKFFFSANLIHSFHRSEIWTYCVWVLCSNSHRDCQQAVSLSGAQSLSQAHSACWQSQVPCGCRTKVSLLTVGRDLLSAFRGQLCSLPHAPSIFKASNGDSYEKSV